MIRLAPEEAEEIREDITQVLNAVPQLEKLARVKLEHIAPGAARALTRLKKTRDTLK